MNPLGHKTHGLSGGKAGTNPLYRKWITMRSRCENPRNSRYHRYGGRGIKVCAEWSTYPPFHEWATSNGWKPGLTIERKDNDGDYSPENCSFITTREQARNTSKTRLITWKGRTRTITEWSRDLGGNHAVIAMRLGMGWDLERALFTPLRGYDKNSWSVYLILCQTTTGTSIYTGISLRPEARFGEHKRGKIKYTRSNKPLSYAVFRSGLTHSEALKLEYDIKQKTHAEKQKLYEEVVK